MGIKCNKIELLLFLKKHDVINDNSYLNYLIDGKDLKETLDNILKYKDMIKIKEIKETLRKKKKASKLKLILQDIEYIVFSIVYVMLMMDIVSLNIATSKAYIISILTSFSFAMFTLRIFKSDYKKEVKKINSELNLINFIENKLRINN